MTVHGHGLLIGKFYPPHDGHHAAIRLAARHCEQVTVLVMASAVETVALVDRVAWLRAEHHADDNVLVAGILCDATVDVSDEQIWTAQVATMHAALRAAGVHRPVDAVYCGDSYGAELARRFAATAVELHRTPMCSTAVRRTSRAAGTGWRHRPAPDSRPGWCSSVPSPQGPRRLLRR